VQNAHDLNASGVDSIEDEIRKCDQGPCACRYFGPGATGLGIAPQRFDAGFESVVEIVGRGRIDLIDFEPEIDQIAARAGRIADRWHLLRFRFAHRQFAFGRAPQFGKIDHPGIAAFDSFPPRPSQTFDTLSFFAVGSFE